jgi:hypothetical protein
MKIDRPLRYAFGTSNAVSRRTSSSRHVKHISTVPQFRELKFMALRRK